MTSLDPARVEPPRVDLGGVDVARTVLVVEDDRTINEALSIRLRAEGYEVEQAFDGPQAVTVAENSRIDVVVLDLMLPGFDGHEVCRRIHAVSPIPVLMLTARDEETDILTGLGIGADDYLTKPFRMREVVARVAALLRRVERAQQFAQQSAEQAAAPHSGTAPLVLTVGDLVIDTAARRTTVGGARVHLTPTEFDLLVCLASQPDTVRTREVLLAEVWGWGEGLGSRTVDSHVKALRAKVGAGRVRTVHGVGYAMETP